MEDKGFSSSSVGPSPSLAVVGAPGTVSVGGTVDVSTSPPSLAVVGASGTVLLDGTVDVSTSPPSLAVVEKFINSEIL